MKKTEKSIERRKEILELIRNGGFSTMPGQKELADRFKVSEMMTLVLTLPKKLWNPVKVPCEISIKTFFNLINPVGTTACIWENTLSYGGIYYT